MAVKIIFLQFLLFSTMSFSQNSFIKKLEKSIPGSWNILASEDSVLLNYKEEAWFYNAMNMRVYNFEEELQKDIQAFGFKGALSITLRFEPEWSPDGLPRSACTDRGPPRAHPAGSIARVGTRSPTYLEEFRFQNPRP